LKALGNCKILKSFIPLGVVFELVLLRRYAGMGLTNLTFGDGTNKALLCSFRGFMQALVAQLASPSEDLR
jgi:hypothetical protein